MESRPRAPRSPDPERVAALSSPYAPSHRRYQRVDAPLELPALVGTPERLARLNRGTRAMRLGARLRLALQGVLEKARRRIGEVDVGQLGERVEHGLHDLVVRAPAITRLAEVAHREADAALAE